MVENKIQLSGTEWRLMQVLWANGPCTFKTICDGVGESGWTKHSIISFLKRMEAKNAIRIEDAKPVKLYHPLLDKDDTLYRETSSLLDRVYNGDLLLMVSNAVKQQALSEEEIDELVALLKGGAEK